MKGKFESVGRLLSVVLLKTGIMGMAGCGRHADADESHLLGKKAESGDGYELRTVEYAQTDGKKMKVELPFELEKDNTEEGVSGWREDSYSHYDYDRFLSVEMVHVSGLRPGRVFDMEGFLKVSFVDPEGLKVTVKDRGTRVVNGLKMTYLDVQLLDEENGSQRPARLLNLGFFGGEGEFWAISYFAYEDDKLGQKMIEKSIESIKVE